MTDQNASTAASTSAPVVDAQTAPNAAGTAPAAQDSVVPEQLVKINRDLKERAVAQKAQQFGLGYIDLEKVPINSDLASIIPQAKAKAALITPFFRVGKKLRIAVANPDNPSTKALFVQLKTQGYLLNANLASDDGINAALAKLYERENRIVKPKLVTQVEESEIKSYEEELAGLSQIAEKIKNVTAEEGLNMLYIGAIKTGTSDIHIEPDEGTVVIRFRIDGFLQKVIELDPKTYANLANQLKYKAGMKLNISNVPQDGRDSFMYNERKIDVRVSALPTEFGEAIVCRLLDSGKSFLDIKDCQFIYRNLDLVEKAVHISHGMILVTGPTGSGKTTTLYSMLHEFNKPENKVITLEDPIEYHLKGVSQSQINQKRGFTFASGLRSILRQDPDIVMVGEIRDLETAETAAQAALTGHVMLSTLHTNSALETIPRLVNIGLPPFMVAPSLYMVIAQRLVRKLCEYCKQSKPITDNEREEIQTVCYDIQKINPKIECTVPAELWHPRECKKCSHTGYSGRIPIHEILMVDEEMKELILQGASLKELTAHARKHGMLTMKEDGILKVLANQTTLEEVRRVTMVIEEVSNSVTPSAQTVDTAPPAPTSAPAFVTPSAQTVDTPPLAQIDKIPGT